MLAATLSLACCNREHNERTVALITPLTTSELWKSVHAGVVEATREKGLNWYWNAPTHENDPERQLELVDRQVSLGVAGVVLIPAHSSVLISAVTQAEKMKVPLVIAGESLTIPLNAETGSVGTDEQKSGMLAAGLADEILHGQGAVAIVGLNRASNQVLVRATSFERALHASGLSHIRIKLDDTVGPGGKSQPDLLHMLHDNTSPRLVFAASPSATRAAYATMQEAGLLGQVALIGSDQDPELFPALKNGEIQGLIAENAYQIGFKSAAMLIAASEAKTPLSHILLAPLLLTRSNIDSPETKTFLHPYSGFDR